MKSLSETWFAEGYIDFELKKYTLLAYLQQVNSYFNENKLYPQLADIIFHYNNLVAFRENKKFLQEHFPKKLSGIQLEKLQFLYEQMVEDDELMKELEEIINYSTSTIKETINNGTEIYEFIEDKLVISPIGLIPLDTNEGYFFLSSVRTSYIDNQRRSMTNTYETIKADLIRYRNELPNPAVYAVEIELNFPYN